MNKSEEGVLSKTFEDMLYKIQNRRADITDRVLTEIETLQWVYQSLRAEDD